MSLQSVRAFLAEHAPEIEILEATTSTATVALAAAAHGVEPARIAKTLSLRLNGDAILIVMGGEARLDNRKYKDRFAAKAKMLDAGGGARGDEPSGRRRLPVRAAAAAARLCRRLAAPFDVVVPAAGDTHHALRIAPDRLVRARRRGVDRRRPGARWGAVIQAANGCQRCSRSANREVAFSRAYR